MVRSQDELDTEIELIQASLLPAESADLSQGDGQWPKTLKVESRDSELWLNVGIEDGYPARQAVKVEVKGKHLGRDEAEGWRAWVEQRMDEWDEDDDYPLYQLLTTHFLALLAPSSVPPPSPPRPPSAPIISSAPHHALLTSHHLLSPTKRKDLLALSSSLSLVGFSKTGHPGIMYAIGEASDLDEWIREVKSWNWLALKVRVGVEPIEGAKWEDEGEGRGKEDGARGGKGRGEWIEVEKLGEALEWLKGRGRERLLLDLGMGGSGAPGGRA